MIKYKDNELTLANLIMLLMDLDAFNGSKYGIFIVKDANKIGVQIVSDKHAR